jgi:hypothetical protein
LLFVDKDAIIILFWMVGFLWLLSGADNVRSFSLGRDKI